MIFCNYLDEEKCLALKAEKDKAYDEWLDADHNAREAKRKYESAKDALLEYEVEKARKEKWGNK